MERVALWLIGIGAALYLFVLPHEIEGDGAARYGALVRLLQSGELTPMYFSYVGPLFSAPLHYLGLLAVDPVWWVSRFNSFVFLITLVFVYRHFRADWGRGGARLLVLLLFTASMFPAHATQYYAEVFSACLAALALIAFQRERFLSGAALLCLSTWNSPGTAVGSALVLLYFAVDRRRFRYLAVIPLLSLGIVVESKLQLGAWFPSAYVNIDGYRTMLPYTQVPGFGYPLFFGVLSVLFSYGKGLVFFCPGLLALFTRRPWDSSRPAKFLAASLCYLVGLVLVYARWRWWEGDWFWGPRFYLFASLPAAVALVATAPLHRASLFGSALWCAAALLSLWIGCAGAVFGQYFLISCLEKGYEFSFVCSYVPEYSPLWRMFRAWPELKASQWILLSYFLVVAAFVMTEQLRGLFEQVVAAVKRLDLLCRWKL